MIAPEVLSILCCPETHQQVRCAEGSWLETLNGRIRGGQVRNRSGQPVREPLEAGLIRADGQFLYPIRNRIPVMLTSEAIPLTGT